LLLCTSKLVPFQNSSWDEFSATCEARPFCLILFRGLKALLPPSIQAKYGFVLSHPSKARMGHPRLCRWMRRKKAIGASLTPVVLRPSLTKTAQISFGSAQGRLSLRLPPSCSAQDDTSRSIASDFHPLGRFVESCAYLIYVRSMGSDRFVQLIAGHSELATPVGYV